MKRRSFFQAVRKRLPKKLAITILVLLALLVTLSNWRTGVFESGDFGFHTLMLSQFYDSLRAGILFPRWVGDFCNNFGSPEFRFFYTLPYYIASVFHFLGFGIITSLKLFLLGAYMTAGLVMYWWLRKEVDENSALVGAIFYMFSPYMLTTLHFTHAIGELLGLALAPIILLFTKDLITKRNALSFLALTLAYALLIFAHHVAPLLLLPIILGYAWARAPQGRQLLLVILSLVLGELLTAYHWLPIILDAHYIWQSTAHVVRFSPLLAMFISRWKLGLLFQGPMGEVYPIVGYMHVLMIGAAIFLRRSFTPVERKIVYGCLAVTAGSLVLMMPIMQPLWEHLPLLQNFQFSSRLFWPIVVVMGPLAAIVSKYLFAHQRMRRLRSRRQAIMVVICGLAICLTVLNWGNRGMRPDIDDASTRAQVPGRCDQLVLPRSVDPKIFPYAKRNADIEVIKGEVSVGSLKRSIEVHSYSLTSTTSATLQENTVYFPGWEATLDNAPLPIRPSEDGVGLMLVDVPAGMHTVVFSYGLTPPEKLGAGLSLLSFISTVLYMLYTSQRKIF